jgi:PPM family protein phosphatase
LLVLNLNGDVILLAVADGMGGPPGGEIAAQLTVDTLARLALVRGKAVFDLLAMIEAANHRVLTEGERQPNLQGMGCTLTVVLVEENLLSWGQVGDSRLYLFRRGKLNRLTTDQNLAQQLVAAGRLSAEEARFSPYRHILEQCVGCRSCRPESGKMELFNGDQLLLATDGLHGEMADEEIGSILAAAGEPDRIALALVEAALAHGGRDNITVVIAAL